MKNLIKVYALMRETDAAISDMLPDDQVIKFGYCVAGGALRDTICGQEVKDIDIVVENPDDWGEILAWTEFHQGDFEYDEGHVTHLCTPGLTVQGKPLQFMARTTSCHPQAMSNYHALAMSNMFWFEGQLVIDETALRDLTDSEHTAHKGRWSEAGFKKYYDKVFKKYPWPLRGSTQKKHEDLI